VGVWKTLRAVGSTSHLHDMVLGGRLVVWATCSFSLLVRWGVRDSVHPGVSRLRRLSRVIPGGQVSDECFCST